MNAGDPPDPHDGPGHTKTTIALRILAALLVAGAAVAVQRTVLADEQQRDTYGAKVVSKQIDSSELDRKQSSRVVVPDGAPSKDRGLVVFLHGRGEDERSYLDNEMFEALAELGPRAPVMAFPSAGASSYWHDRESGAWGTYVLSDVIPQLVSRFDIDPDKIAIGGISMGGYGALNIASRSPGRFCAVAGHSPAIWESASQTADGAFDNADDFARHDVIEAAGRDPNPLEGVRIWLDAGDEDPFLAGDDALEEALRSAGQRPIVSRSPGGHNSDYWNGNWEEYLGFYARSLRACASEAQAERRAERQAEERAAKRAEEKEANTAGGDAMDDSGQSP